MLDFVPHTNKYSLSIIKHRLNSCLLALDTYDNYKYTNYPIYRYVAKIGISIICDFDPLDMAKICKCYGLTESTIRYYVYYPPSPIFVKKIIKELYDFCSRNC